MFCATRVPADIGQAKVTASTVPAIKVYPVTFGLSSGIGRDPGSAALPDSHNWLGAAVSAVSE